MKKLLTFSIFILLFLTSCDDKKYKSMPLDTLLNYPGSVVLSKTEMYSEPYRIIALRIKNKSGYKVKEIKIPRSEWITVELGDTVNNNINIKDHINRCEAQSESIHNISSINNYKGGIVIEKDLDKVSFTDEHYLLTIKIVKDFTGKWTINKIRVVESEYNSVEVGDTIK